jgi:hypothetical protein
MSSPDNETIFSFSLLAPAVVGLMARALVATGKKSDPGRIREEPHARRISAPFGIALTGISIVLTMFLLAYGWEFWAESAIMKFLGVPYDDIAEANDNWRKIGSAGMFAAISLIAHWRGFGQLRAEMAPQCHGRLVPVLKTGVLLPRTN